LTDLRASYDVVIIGGGPAGLSAATVLGRCLRRVLLCDAGSPRNAASAGMHCYLSRDGIAPAAFLAAAREDLARYPTVEALSCVVEQVARHAGGFIVDVGAHGRFAARKVLFATGVVDILPDIGDFDRFYGRSIHHCPYCDGFEHRGETIAVYGQGEKGAGLALMMRQWSEHVFLLTNGPAGLDDVRRGQVTGQGIAIDETPVAALEGDAPHLAAVRLIDGRRIACTALFFNTGQAQRSPLLAALSCETTGKGGIVVGEHEQTNVPGVFVAGDASRDVQLVIVAAAEGAIAAKAIHAELLAEDGLC